MIEKIPYESRSITQKKVEREFKKNIKRVSKRDKMDYFAIIVDGEISMMATKEDMIFGLSIYISALKKVFDDKQIRRFTDISLKMSSNEMDIKEFSNSIRGDVTNE